MLFSFSLLRLVFLAFGGVNENALHHHISGKLFSFLVSDHSIVCDTVAILPEKFESLLPIMKILIFV
jgi:hypothetical protein